jgi:glycyl-tRNA synthetase beta chain
VVAHGIPARQTDHEEEAMGPAVRAAYDDQGQPTRALLGFCQGRGVDVSTARRVQTPKGEYVAVTVKHVGRDAADVLPAMLAEAAGRLTFPKTMRWTVGTEEARFARPVRWLVALLGDRVLAVEAFGITAGRTSQGTVPGARRGRDPEAVRLSRRAREGEGGGRPSRPRAAAARPGRPAGGPGRAAGWWRSELMEINDFLVEWPTAFAGRFDDRYLDLPREVIVTALREHQRSSRSRRPTARCCRPSSRSATATTAGSRPC